MIGLDGQASDIVVYDGEDCSKLTIIIEDSQLLIPLQAISILLESLDPKMGGVRGRNNLHNYGLSSSIPLIGPLNIIGKPIAVLCQDGSIWACGELYQRTISTTV